MDDKELTEFLRREWMAFKKRCHSLRQFGDARLLFWHRSVPTHQLSVRNRLDRKGVLVRRAIREPRGGCGCSRDDSPALH